MESAKISDLMFLRALLMLEICSLEDNMKLEMLLLPMGTITCVLEGFSVVILIQDFFFLGLLTILSIFLIFFADKLEKFFFNL